MRDAERSELSEPALALGSQVEPDAAYRVLARKYRPSSFDQLIGQDAMVRTVTNAFETSRIPQAWLLTGVRGVGKTTTARILARALNYELPDGSIAGPTVKMPVLGTHCQAIMESRHIDVMEMDAASHNGVDDIRQINDAIRYAPVSARYKVYILDEVHMLTPQAFNALLKTLEEPPPHAKFVFATTEARKVPITVLSRCQRFDLRRVDAGLLVTHLEAIARKEAVQVSAEALALIARAAEGSVRDALSLLDQAIAHAAGAVAAEHVRQMLGLVERTRIIDLFEALMRGHIAAALAELRAQYDAGADPAVVLTDLADFTHFVTRVKIVPGVADDPSLIEVERVRGRAFAESLSMRVLSRTWQMLLKGIAEVSAAGRPLAAAEMVLVRIAYAAGLPTPDEVVRSFTGGGTPDSTGAAAPTLQAQAAAPPPASPGAALSSRTASLPGAGADPARDPVVLAEKPASTPGRAISQFQDLIALASENRDVAVKLALERDVRLVRCEEGRLEVRIEPSAAKTLVNDLARKFSQWTNRRWMVVVSAEEGAPTVKAQHAARQAELKLGVRADPLVEAVLARFPGAEIVDVRKNEMVAPALPTLDAEENIIDSPAGEDVSVFGIRGRPDDL